MFSSEIQNLQERHACTIAAESNLFYSNKNKQVNTTFVIEGVSKARWVSDRLGCTLIE